ncbi:diguanylate cyclase [Desulforudis sp. 1031]|uniref:diguanylate cyclase n=1 Tax=Desulforudis sp. Tu-874 TaxID=3416276 RepID=UPI003CE550C1
MVVSLLIPLFPSGRPGWKPASTPTHSSGKNLFQNEINTWIEELTEYSLPVVANLFLLEETTRLSVTDALTGLYNRRFLEAFLEQQLALFVRTGQPFAVLILDLDHFKLFNDTFGHQAGDAALRAVAQAVQKSLRAADVVARYGGEEFVVILPQTDAGTAFEIAERLRQVVAGTSLPDPQRPAEYLPPLTVSVGVAVCPAHATTLGTLLHAADAAMYAAKQAGRNRVVVAQAE